MYCNIPYPIIDMKGTGENIRKLRIARGLTVADVQRFLGLSEPQAIYQWQRGQSLPTVDHLCALSRLFKVSMDEILVLSDHIEDKHNRKVPNKKNSMKSRKALMLLWAA